MLEQLLGWIGNIFFILGVYMLGDKNIKGFYLNTIANILYIYQSILMHNPALLWLSIGLAILNIKGIYQWIKYNDTHKEEIRAISKSKIIKKPLRKFILGISEEYSTLEFIRATIGVMCLIFMISLWTAIFIGPWG